MTLMLALVQDAEEAAIAIQEGVDRLVVVGATSLPDLAAVAALARGRCPVSLWWSGLPAGLAAASAACGADQLWGVGLARSSGQPIWEVVAAGDRDRIASASRRGCVGVVIDGASGPGRLLAETTVASLEAQRRQVRTLGLGLALSGGMEAPDVARLLAFAPDVLVLSDLLRRDGLAAGRISPERVRAARALMADAAAMPAPGQGAAATEPDRIFLRDWVVSIPLGAYRHERDPQRVRFTVEAEVARVTDRAADMRHVVTYDLISDAISRATIAHVALVETIAEDVAAMILAHPRVAGVDVTVEKLDLGPGSLGCRILRRRTG